MNSTGKYDASSGLIDYIYGITYEIWEERGVELIRQYYGEDVEMYSLGGVSRGVESIVKGTYDTLASFPDRKLLPENVVWSTDADGQYSSHRILSPMTNDGPSLYGPATNKQAWVRTVADCLVQDGVIIREWLMRDTLPLVLQLGFEPTAAAQLVTQGFDDTTMNWFTSERRRLETPSHVDHPWTSFALGALTSIWKNDSEIERYYPHYTVLHPDPVSLVSGLDALRAYGADLRESFGDVRLSVDHLAVQPWSHDGHEVAVRWTVSAKHTGTYQNLAATNKDVYILGTSHWRIYDEKVLTGWTVFDGMGVLAQLV